MSLILSLIAAAFYSVSSAMLSRTLKARTHIGATTLGTVRPAHVTVDAGGAAETNGNSEAALLRQSAHNHRLTLIFATIAVVIHGWLVINQTGLPYELSLPLFTSVSATTLTIVLLHIVLCLRQPADYLGLAVYPLAAVSLIISQASGGGHPIIGNAIQIHVLLSLISYGVLALAAAQAVLVAIQRHYLATHKPGGFIRALPPFDTTEQLLFSLLAAGFVMLSLALASGFLFLDSMFDQHLVHKTVLSCIGWAIFGVLLYGRWRYGWRVRKAVHWTLWGFGLLIIAYFGSKAAIEIFLVN